ncbi:hypothetical protein HDA40_006581 [Hamadaea flava]|uniref:Uncharacterized protein n=1 Tax=Hamadaea flava TaxID=1742688 RepID=A0ABV8LT09_9ACTN|nr:hypothetical protein [Hamadaea flava]MCP2328074.1 hypothetical protein [Hamadaea flava]
MTDLFPPNLSDRPAAPVPHAPALDISCRYCGSRPAVDVTFKRHTGMFIMRQTVTYPGPFCRDCGLSVFRSATAHTVGVGWAGLLSLFIFPFVVLGNLLSRRKLTGLAEPTPPVDAPVRPAHPGKPLLLRPLAYVLLVPILILGLGAWAAAKDTAENQVGRCVTVLTDTDVDIVDCAQRHDGVIVSVVDRDASCPASAIGEVERMSGDLNRDGGKKLCVGEG